MGVIPTPTPTPTRKLQLQDEERPIPREYLIGGAIAAGVVLLGILYGAIRAWRTSNLFGRQYRFPTTRDAAVRLGGEKSGGHMATVRFGPERAAPEESSKAKDA